MTYKKKLIEVALPLEDINREAAREKSIRYGHPSTLHLWWARRPLAACRAVLFASLVDDPSECVKELLSDAVKREAAAKELKTRRKTWAVLKATFDKARGAGMKSASDPGFEPKLEKIIVEMERERLFDIIRELVKWENSSDERVLNRARAEILRSTGGKPPPVYDPFCGGGSIPLEAQRLGLEAHASDLNPVPVLITKALIEFPPKFAGKPPVNPEAKKRLGVSGSWKGAAGLAEDIRYYGQWMRDEAGKRIGHFYPKAKLPKEYGGGEATVIAWVWARTVASPNPAAKGTHVPLIRSYWLSTKGGKRTWVEPVIDQSGMNYRFEIRTGEPDDAKKVGAGTKSARGANFVCLLTQTPITPDYIKSEAVAGRLSEKMVAIVAEGNRQRIFLPPDPQHELLATTCPESWEPEQSLADDPRNIWCVLYGFDKFSKLFTRRQLLALNTFSDLIEVVRKEIALCQGATLDYADSVVTYLAFVVAKSADYWSSFSTWRSDPKNLGVGHLFSRQAIPMVWDFAEGNPLSSSSGSWESNQSWVELVVKRSVAGTIGHVCQASASSLEEMRPVIFSTDPPYYDNISYANLSDFFYVWLRRCLSKVHPELFGTLLPPKAEELIADPARFEGNKEKAKDFFESGLQKVFGFIRTHQSKDFPVTVFYAFRQSEQVDDDPDDAGESVGNLVSTGWETFLSGVLNSGFSVDGTWPMRTELANKITMGTNILASSIVLVCRPRPQDAGIASRREFLGALKRELPEALRNLQKGNIAPVDLAQAAIGPGMAVFSRFARVLEADGSPMSVRTALSLINQSLDEVLAEQEGEFDADTRWALAWFDQNGFNEGAYGVAETLCTAKNTSVSGMVEAGILAAKAGKVRLLKKDELDPDWDPATDERLTVWEATHHLIRSLDDGEQVASALLKKLGPLAEVARDLSYRLYTVCERRKWSQEAIGYNSLVLSWPDLKRLADEQKEFGPSQKELI
jgi:putative DNA methylase